MEHALATYLMDHHAGAKFGIELVEHLEKQCSGQELGRFAEKLRPELEEDRATLQAIIDAIADSAPAVKKAAAWLSEKAARLKFSDGPLGTFEALEVLSLGILGKLKLWHALAKISESDDRLKRFNFVGLVARAQSQHDNVEQYRLEVAEQAFTPVSELQKH